MVSSCVIAARSSLIFLEPLEGPSAARTYSGELSTATWPRRRTVSRGRSTKRATVAEQNLASEKVVGETSLSILNLVRKTRGVVSASTGCTSECRTVGRTSVGGQR